MSKYARLYSSILKSAWAIEPRTAQQWYPQVQSLIQDHSTLAFDDDQQDEPKKPSAILDFYTVEGQPLDNDMGDDLPEGTVAVMDIIGPMIKWGNMFCWGADEYAMLLQNLLSNPNVSGVVLRVDSGGGAVDAIAPITQVLQNRNKPVIALCDLCASAAYFFAAYCDEIWAENDISSEFGSIGVMVSFYNDTKYLADKGIERVVIYAPESTHKNKPFELALQGNYELIESEMLSPLAQRFQSAVRQLRPGLSANVEGILNGRMFYATSALQHGLINRIGTLAEAVQRINSMRAAGQLRNINLNHIQV